MRKYDLRVLDRELACAPFKSKEGQNYFAAMVCSANMAFANRQVITHRIREAFSKVFGRDAESLGLHIIYDVAHNIAKIEKHTIEGSSREVLVHRKGSTRAFGPGREELGALFQNTGQPVILGGSMETGSYLLAGTQKAVDETFGSTAHGSGRTMSRAQAKKRVSGNELLKTMEKKGIYVRAASMEGLAEEAGFAYKNIFDVVDTITRAGISKPVVALAPLGNIKG
jgi:tRNA-splicing ligase RtcB